MASSEQRMMASESSRRSWRVRTLAASSWTSPTSRKMATAPSTAPAASRTTMRLVMMVVAPTSWRWFSSSWPEASTSGSRVFGTTSRTGRPSASFTGQPTMAAACWLKRTTRPDVSTAMSPSMMESRMEATCRIDIEGAMAMESPGPEP